MLGHSTELCYYILSTSHSPCHPKSPRSKYANNCIYLSDSSPKYFRSCTNYTKREFNPGDFKKIIYNSLYVVQVLPILLRIF